MPQLILDTDGAVELRPPGATFAAQCTYWTDLGPFEQGYIEALFFTEDTPENLQDGQAPDEDTEYRPHGFSDLAPETLARILADCAAFQAKAIGPASAAFAYVDQRDRWASAGHDFWHTRNGHGCGFWDGDWPEPYATQLTDAAKGFGQVDAYLGDDGKVYLS